MTPIHWTISAIALATSLLIIRQIHNAYLHHKLLNLQNALQSTIAQNFLVQPCSRCHESDMRFIQCSPHAKSIHYECLHCQKKNHAPALSTHATHLPQQWDTYQTLSARLNKNLPIQFETPEALLPYQQTTRTPIPEAIRSEIWRRDQGRCTICQNKENLQFDHIIPLSKGGATTVKNLQILCAQCNQHKGNNI